MCVALRTVSLLTALLQLLRLLRLLCVLSLAVIWYLSMLLHLRTRVLAQAAHFAHRAAQDIRLAGERVEAGEMLRLRLMYLAMALALARTL